MIKINRTDFKRKLADKHNFYYKQADEIIDIFLDTLKDCMLEGESVTFKDFMTIGSRDSKSYIGMNPIEKVPVEVPSKRMPFCRFGKGLKREVAESKNK